MKMEDRTNIFSVCEDVIFHVLKQLPVKSLMRFKCVSKGWLGLIENPYFMDCHRAYSHRRSGGIKLLSMANEGYSSFLLDPDGKSEPDWIPLPKRISLSKNRISHAEGLVCFGNCLWNPSTRERMFLPPATSKLDAVLDRRYLVGFDDSSGKYKVLCCWTCDARKVRRKNLVDKVPHMKVLTLGTKLWRRVRCLSEIPRDGCVILSSLSFSNTIFCLVRCGPFRATGVLTFDVRDEVAGFVSFPAGFKFWKHNNSIKLAEIGGRLGFHGIGSTIWVLNREVARWTKIEITISGCPGLSSGMGLWVDFVHDGHNSTQGFLTPLGTIQTNEILFECFKQMSDGTEGTLGKHFYYDPKTKKIRFVPNLFGDFEGIWQLLIIKHVESVFQLKPRKC